MNDRSVQPELSLRAAARARLAEAAVVAAAKVPLRAVRRAGRGPEPVASARQTAMYLAHVVFGISLTRVGICFGRDRTTVRHACALVEDRRDDHRVECGLNALEAALLSLWRGLEHRLSETRR